MCDRQDRMGGIIMEEISAKEIMEYWNNAHPDSPCTLQDVKAYLETHAFFNLGADILVKIMENDFNDYVQRFGN